MVIILCALLIIITLRLLINIVKSPKDWICARSYGWKEPKQRESRKARNSHGIYVFLESLFLIPTYLNQIDVSASTIFIHTVASYAIKECVRPNYHQCFHQMATAASANLSQLTLLRAFRLHAFSIRCALALSLSTTRSLWKGEIVFHLYRLDWSRKLPAYLILMHGWCRLDYYLRLLLYLVYHYHGKI